MTSQDTFYILFYIILLINITKALVMINPCCNVFEHTAANFGPHRPDGESIEGHVIYSIPSDGCELSKIDYNGSIVLVSRSSCHFSKKVELAQEKGAIAVVIMNEYDDSIDDNNNLLVTMAASDMDDSTSNIKIPSYFISYNSGKILNNTMVLPMITINSTGEVTSRQYPFDFVTIFWSILIFFFQVMTWLLYKLLSSLLCLYIHILMSSKESTNHY
jgi:hypothetical protein